MNIFNSDICHEYIMDKMEPKLTFKYENDYYEWRSEVKEKFKELLGDMPESEPADFKIEYIKEYDEFIEKRFVFTTERYANVPCHLLLPKTGKNPYPVVICLQGHSTGMHISMGRVKYPGDEKSISGGDRDFALQAIKNGYAALVVEQRCFGERRGYERNDKNKTSCHHTSMTALLIGRTMIGERIWDISRAIDALNEFDEIDMGRIACMGNSAGGTTAFYAACFDERIGVVMPSCSVCAYKESWGKLLHCWCSYIPSIAKYVDMGDLACLIAPRPLIVVAGMHDHIAPINAVKTNFELIKKVYKVSGSPDNCSLVIGDEGHRFYANLSWPEFDRLSHWQ